MTMISQRRQTAFADSEMERATTAQQPLRCEAALQALRAAFEADLQAVTARCESRLQKELAAKEAKDALVTRLMEENRLLLDERDRLLLERAGSHPLPHAQKQPQLQPRLSQPSPRSNLATESNEARSRRTQTPRTTPPGQSNRHTSLLAEIDLTLSTPRRRRPRVPGPRLADSEDKCIPSKASKPSWSTLRARVRDRASAAGDATSCGGDDLLSLPVEVGGLAEALTNSEEAGSEEVGSEEVGSEEVDASGRSFFRAAREFLADAEFDALLQGMKALNQGRQDRAGLVREAEAIFGPEGWSLARRFRELLALDPEYVNMVTANGYGQ